MPTTCKLTELEEDLEIRLDRKQRTLAHPISATGIGLFTGEMVTFVLRPAEENSGIVFQRVDLPGAPFFPADLDHLISSSRCTMLRKEDAVVQTVEHLLAALHALGIGNIHIEINGPEVPIFDGSSLPFAKLILEAGVVEQSRSAPVYTLSSPVYFAHNETQLVALPADEYRISYALHYPHSPFLQSQFYTTAITQEQFLSEIAPCRTFSLYEEVMPLLDKKIIKGGSLENGVIVRGNEVLNPEGVRFPDEMARHKALDIVGDLALMGLFFKAHIIAIRSGHAANHALAREMRHHLKMERL